SVTYTDQLGRQTKVEIGTTDTDGTPLAVRVIVPGYQGAVKYYKIKAGIMNQNYRSGINPVLPVINGDWDYDGIYAWTVPHTSLFSSYDLGGSFGGNAERIDTSEVLTDLILPDNRSLHFAYNEYGEVAEVQMPTGGKMQYDYDYAPYLPSGNSLTF